MLVEYFVIKSKFELHKIINDVKTEYVQSFLTYAEAKFYANTNSENGGLDMSVFISGGKYILYDVYKEVNPVIKGND